MYGSYYLLGGYVGLTVIWQSGHFLLAILAGAVAIALLGVVEWGVFLRRLGGQELGQVLTTMGIALIFQSLGLVIWGGGPHTIRISAALSGSYQIGTLFFPIYRKAFLTALRKVEIPDAPRGPIKLDAYDNPIQNLYVRKVEKKNGELRSRPTRWYSRSIWVASDAGLARHPHLLWRQRCPARGLPGT